MRGSNERTPADGSAGVADGGSCCAHAVNSRPMRAELSDELGAMAFKHPFGPPTASVRDRAASAVLRGQTCLPPVAVEAVNVPVLDVLREIRSSFRATSFAEIAKIVERVECPTFQRLSQFIRSHFRRKVRVDDDISDLFSAFDNRC